MLADTELGIPTNRKASGNKTRNAAAITLPHRLRIQPMMTMERMKMNSSTVKLVGSM